MKTEELNKIEKEWDKKELYSENGDHKVIIYKNKLHPSYTFEFHPMDDNETEDENGNELKEPNYFNAWYWFPAKDGKGIPNSPSTMSETSGYNRENALNEFYKEFIEFNREFNN